MKWKWRWLESVCTLCAGSLHPSRGVERGESGPSRPQQWQQWLTCNSSSTIALWPVTSHSLSIEPPMQWFFVLIQHSLKLKVSQSMHYAEVEKVGSKWSTLNNNFSTNFQPKWAKFSTMMYKHPNIWKHNLFSKFVGQKVVKITTTKICLHFLWQDPQIWRRKNIFKVWKNGIENMFSLTFSMHKLQIFKLSNQLSLSKHYTFSSKLCKYVNNTHSSLNNWDKLFNLASNFIRVQIFQIYLSRKSEDPIITTPHYNFLIVHCSALYSELFRKFQRYDCLISLGSLTKGLKYFWPSAPPAPLREPGKPGLQPAALPISNLSFLFWHPQYLKSDRTNFGCTLW